MRVGVVGLGDIASKAWLPVLLAQGGVEPVLVTRDEHRLAGLPDDVRRVVFDDFVHVVDTLRFLLDGVDGSGRGEDVVSVTARGDEQGLRRVALQLTRGQRLAVGVMSRTAGLTEEVLEVVADGRRRRVLDLAEVTDSVGASCTTRRDEWVPVAVQRGFAGLAEHFLAGVRSGRVLDASDALVTHRMCEQVVREVEEALGRPA